MVCKSKVAGHLVSAGFALVFTISLFLMFGGDRRIDLITHWVVRSDLALMLSGTFSLIYYLMTLEFVPVGTQRQIKRRDGSVKNVFQSSRIPASNSMFNKTVDLPTETQSHSVVVTRNTSDGICAIAGATMRWRIVDPTKFTFESGELYAEFIHRIAVETASKCVRNSHSDLLKIVAGKQMDIAYFNPEAGQVLASLGVAFSMHVDADELMIHSLIPQPKPVATQVVVAEEVVAAKLEVKSLAMPNELAVPEVVSEFKTDMTPEQFIDSVSGALQVSSAPDAQAPVETFKQSVDAIAAELEAAKAELEAAAEFVSVVPGDTESAAANSSQFARTDFTPFYEPTHPMDLAEMTAIPADGVKEKKPALDMSRVSPAQVMPTYYEERVRTDQVAGTLSRALLLVDDELGGGADGATQHQPSELEMRASRDIRRAVFEKKGDVNAVIVEIARKPYFLQLPDEIIDAFVVQSTLAYKMSLTRGREGLAKFDSVYRDTAPSLLDGGIPLRARLEHARNVVPADNVALFPLRRRTEKVVGSATRPGELFDESHVKGYGGAMNIRRT